MIMRPRPLTQAVVIYFVGQVAWTFAFILFDPSDGPDGRDTPSNIFGFARPDQGGAQPTPLFSSVVTSSKSSNKDSRTERTIQEALTHSQSREWSTGLQKGPNGGVQKLNSESSEEKTEGRSSKGIKASESGDSFERETRNTQVNGQSVVSSDTGKQSSFSNSGQVSNDTRFLRESSSSDNRLEKVVMPPPPPPIVQCFERNRPSIIFLVHTSATADVFARTLGFLETFLSRWRIRVLLVIFNRRVLDVLDYPPSGADDLRGRLAEAARSIRGELNDVCDLTVAVTEAIRLRRNLRLPSPCSLVLLAPGPARFDELSPLELRRAAEDSRRSFDQLTCVVERGPPQALNSRAVDLLGQFSSGGPSALLPLEFGGGDLVDVTSADLLGRQLCDAGEATPGKFEEPGRPPFDKPPWLHV